MNAWLKKWCDEIYASAVKILHPVTIYDARLKLRNGILQTKCDKTMRAVL